VDRGGHSAEGILLILEHIVVVELENERDLAGVLGGDRLDEAKRRGIGIAAGFDRQLDVLAGIVTRRVGGERTARTVFKALVDREDNEFTGAAEATMGQQAGEVGQNARILALVIAQDLGDAGSETGTHGNSFQRATALIFISAA
jgi:hypothetical protein